jgi:hypothetical protein
LALTLAVDQQLASKAAQAKAGTIDGRYCAVPGAIGEIIEAIKDTSGTVRQASEGTGARIASASTTSTDTTRRVGVSVSATEDLSASIKEIGQQASSGVGIAHAARRRCRAHQPADPLARRGRIGVGCRPMSQEPCDLAKHVRGVAAGALLFLDREPRQPEPSARSGDSSVQAVAVRKNKNWRIGA